MKIGYARVSTVDQILDLQMDALNEVGCEKIYQEFGVSGAKTDRPELNKALADLRKGDTLVVWRLDRLGRSLPHLLEVVNGLADRGVEFKTISEGIDTTSTAGKLVFHIMAAMADFERELIRERVKAGMASARARGKNGGRPVTVTPNMIKVGRTLAADKSISVTAICEQLGISRATYYRTIAQTSKAS